jgi:hypothetical protein
MSYLLRVQLPDVPGSLGRLATAIGDAGGNINAIEIVSKGDGFAVDDVFLAPDSGVMPDSIVSACQQVAGMTVLWISRYAAGTNVFLDLEAVESMTEEPELAVDTLVQLAPMVFRVDWAVRVRRDGERVVVTHRTSAAPAEIPADVTWPGHAMRQVSYGDLIVAAVEIGDDEAVVLARRGGPEFLDSELARMRHMIGLATSISRAVAED